MIKNAIAKTETIATARTGRYQFKKVPETIDFLLVLLVLGESRTNRRLLTIDSVSYHSLCILRWRKETLHLLRLGNCNYFYED